jgi:hypothetical protein
MVETMVSREMHEELKQAAQEQGTTPEAIPDTALEQFIKRGARRVLIKAIIVSSALAACPSPQAQPMVHALRGPVVPVRDWPEPQDRPEKTEPPHGEGSGESPLYGGMAVYSTATINVNASGSFMADSGASGIRPYASVAWLPNKLPLIVSTQDFQVVEPFVVAPTPEKVTIQIGPDTKNHMSTPSMIRTRRWFTRRQG